MSRPTIDRDASDACTRRDRIAGIVFMAFGAVSVVGAHKAGIALVMVEGALLLMTGGPLGPIAFATLPLLLLWHARWPWRLAASLPLVSIAVIAVGYVLPRTHILPLGAFYERRKPAAPQCGAAVTVSIHTDEDVAIVRHPAVGAFGSQPAVRPVSSRAVPIVTPRVTLAG